MLPRLVSHFLIVCTMGVISAFITIGHDWKDPIVGFRRKLVWLNFNVLSRFMCYFCFFGFLKYDKISEDDPRGDYSEYLGPNWKKELKEYKESGKKDSLYVCNHMGLFEIFGLCMNQHPPAFVPDARFHKVPLFRDTLYCLNSVFANRAASAQERD